jgi:hypothetical protein
MAYLDQPINVNDLPEDTGGDFLPIPAGDYTASIKSADLTPTKDGSGQYIKLRLDVTGPTHAGRVIFANVNIRNQSSAAEQIGRAQLGAIMKAAGMATLQDTDQLVGVQLGIKVAIREACTTPEGKTYEASNEVKGYKALGGTAPVVNGTMPKPSATAAAPAAGKAAPPWAAKR